MQNMSSERIVQQLINFVRKNGRLPRPDEPGLERVMQEAIEEFGSLEIAFTLAGLTSEDTQLVVQPKREKKIRKIQKPTIKPKNKFQSYPEEYFLNLLKIKRHRSHYPTPEGTPKWWEKKAGKRYSCSSCQKPIEKTERYIGRKTLSPGQRGIYGYKGTYYTHYFHIICLLKEASNKIKKEIEALDQGIEFLEGILVDLKKEISAKTNEIETNRKEIEQKKDDYQTSSRWGKISKLLGYKYSVRVLNQKILRLRKRIDEIENKEIPTKRGTIRETSSNKSELKRYLGRIELEIKKLE